jgi:Tfp pilus assembly protein PilF
MVYCVWRGFFQKKIGANIVALFTAVLAAYFVQNLTVFDSISTLLPFTILFGFSVAISSKEYSSHQMMQSTEDHAERSYFLPAFYTLLFPVIFFYFVIQPLRGGIAFYRAVTIFETTERFRAHNIALNISPFGRDLRREFLALQTARILWGYHPEKDTKVIQQLRTYFIQEGNLLETALQDTIRKSPNDPKAFLYLAMLQQAEGRLFDATKIKDAQQLVRKALEKNPKQKLFYWILVSQFLEQNRIEEAKENMEKALQLSSDSFRSEWNLFIFAKYIGDKSLQETSFIKVTQDYPNSRLRAEEILKWNTEEKKYPLLFEFYLDQ